MPSPRSPSQRATPPPPRIAPRRSPGFRTRGRSPDRRRRMAPPVTAATKYVSSGRSGSPTRSRDRREFRHSPRRESYIETQAMRPSQPPDFPFPRRSRSPLQRAPEGKVRAFSPPKRKLSPPKRERPRSQERERTRAIMPSRKRSRTKSPPLAPVGPSREGPSHYGGGPGGPGDLSPSPRYQIPSVDVDHPRRVGSMAERFRDSSSGSYEKDMGERPVFRGPEGSGFDISELKKISVDIRRNLPGSSVTVERNIINPEDVVLVRRPAKEDYYYRKGEGSRPIFEREEIMEAQSSRSKYGSPPPYDRHGPMDEHRRVVAIVGDPGSGSRYSPPRYADAPHRSRDSYRPHSREHELSSREYSRSRDYERGYEPREKIRDEHFESRRSGGDDLRHELESRRREEPKYLSHERSRSYERSREYRGEDRPGSDLRMRITEKRADRHDDREHRSLEDRDHRPMMQPSPPGSDRRRVAPPDGYISSRVDMERGKPRDNGARPIHHHPVPGPSVRREEPPERFHQKPPPDFSVPPRPDNRFHYKAWDANPEYVPKGRAYFEHDNREDGGMMRGVPRGRGIIRGIPRGRGVMRGRPFRGMGPTRAGFMPPRGMTRRGGYIPRGFFNAY